MAGDRSVTVHLRADIEDYIGPIGRAIHESDALKHAVEEMGGGLKVAGKEADGAGDQLRQLGRSADSAGDNMRQTGRSAIEMGLALSAARIKVRSLSDEFLRSGSGSALTDLKKARNDLRDIENAIKTATPGLIPGGGGGSGGGGAVGGAARAAASGGGALAGILPGGARPSVGAVGVIAGAITLLSPMIAGAIESAVLGGLGLGGIVGGVILASHSLLVKGAFSNLGSSIIAGLRDDAHVFIEPLEKAAEILHDSFIKIEPSIQRIFGMLAPFVDRLAGGFGGFFEKMMPGLEKGFQGALPVLNAIANILPEIGNTLGEVFRILGSGGHNAAKDFVVIMELIDTTLLGTAQTIKFLANTMQWGMSAVDSFLSGYSKLIHLVSNKQGIGFLGTSLGQMFPPLQAVSSALDVVSGGFHAFQSHVNDMVDSSKTLAEQIVEHLVPALYDEKAAADALNQSFDTLFGATMGLDQANLTYRQGLLDVAAAHAKNGNDLRDSTQAGLDNQKVILAQIQDLQNVRTAAIAAGDGTQAASDRATAAYNAQLGSLRATLIGMGFIPAQVDRILSAYRLIPGSIHTEWVADGLSSIVATASGLQRIIQTLDGRTITTFYSDVRLGKSLTPYANLTGGIHYAASGLLSTANMWGPGSTMYGFREPGTGGEGFVPRIGNYARSTSIIDAEARWYGGRFVPSGGQGGGGPMKVEIILSGADATTAVWLSSLRKAVLNRGGNVQVAVMGRP